MKKRGKQLISAMAVLALMTGLFAGCGETETGSTNGKNTSASTEKTADSEEITIRLAVQKNIYLPYVADSLGYFEEEFSEDNINVELVQFSLGPAIVEAMQSGEVEIGFLGDLPAYAGLVNNAEYEIIGRYEKDQTRGLIVRDDAGISQLSDLKGKKVSVPVGSNLQPLLELYLADAGLTDSDIELVNLSHADMITSIAKGEVDAAVTDEPYISLALANGGVTQLLDSTGYKVYVSPIIALNDFTSAHADLTARVLKTLQRAGEWMNENREEAIELSAEATDSEVSDVAPKMEHGDYNVGLSDEDIESFVVGAKQCYEMKLITGDLKVEDYINTSFLEEAGIQ